mmetsp:Transcript_12498/g.23721  ORF Transcript_12498/g.23721 Transcript_12498/m.23721 type:complete len:92 (-) Transcript_12498:1083-1358(-)
MLWVHPTHTVDMLHLLVSRSWNHSRVFLIVAMATRRPMHHGAATSSTIISAPSLHVPRAPPKLPSPVMSAASNLASILESLGSHSHAARSS